MKRWILPAIAAGVVIFLLTDRGREFQEWIADNVGDWTDHLGKFSEKAQDKLKEVQSSIEHFSSSFVG